MKAIRIYEPGSSEKLIYEEVKKPNIKEGWSLIEIKGFGINRSEIFTREGKSPEVKFPRILGIECVGIIIDTTDTKRLPVGQKVISIMGEMGRAFDGSYSEYVLIPNEQIYPIITNFSWEKLAAIPETYYTAYGSFLNLKIKKTDNILVRGASSGVGIAFLNIIKARYPQIIVDGIVDKMLPEKISLLKDIGYNNIFVDKNRKSDIRRKYDKIFELVGPATIKDSFTFLEEGGIICSTGQLGGKWFLENFDPITDIKTNSYLTSFYSNNVNQQKLEEMLIFMEEYEVNIHISRVFSLQEVSKAHDFLESDIGFGKVIVLL